MGTRIFKNNIKHGNFKFYYPDGILGNFENWNNGKEEGIWKMFYPNGNIRKEGTYSNGKKIGLWKTFSQSGELYLTEIWDDGFLLATEEP